MKNGLLYRGMFKNFEEQFVIITIADTLVQIADDAEPNIIQMVMDGDPLHIQIDNAEDGKFSPVFGKKAIIKIISSDAVNISTLMTGTISATRYYTEIEAISSGKYIFKGFLSLSDLQEPFLPLGRTNTFTATDRLGILKNIPLKTFEAANARGHYRIIDFIVWCFAQTGLSLPVNVISNICEEAYAVDSEWHWMNRSFIDAKTLEKDVDEYLDCYEVLLRLCKLDANIGQRNGEWWIKRVDEYDNHLDYVTKFSAAGAFIENQAAVAYNKTIQKETSMFFSQHRTVVDMVEPYKLAKLLHKYETAKEIICNSELSRGTGPEPVGNVEDEEVEYVPECMQFFSLTGLGTYDELDLSEPQAGSEGVLRKIFDYGYEKDRYLTIRTAASKIHYWKLESFKVLREDRFELGIDFKLDSSITGGNWEPLLVMLYADNGDRYVWDYDETTTTTTNEWALISGGTSANTKPWRFASPDTDNWSNIKATCPDVPATGKIVVRIWSNISAANEARFANITVDYKPRIGGSLQKYTGQQFKVEQTAANGLKIDDEVYIGNLPKPEFKGALKRREVGAELYSGSIQFGDNAFILDGNVRGIYPPGTDVYIDTPTYTGFARVTASTYHLVPDNTVMEISGLATAIATETGTINAVDYPLAGFFYNKAVIPTGVPADENLHPFTYIQLFSVWNQYRFLNRKLRFNVQGLESSTTDSLGRCNHPDWIHKFLLTDAHPHTTGKFFMLLNYDQDWKRCEWNGVLVEVLSVSPGKNYADDFEFKYLKS